MIYTAIWYLRGSICSMWQWGKMTKTEKNMNMSSQGHYFQVWKWKDLMFSREHASFHYLLTNIRVDGTSSLLEGWTRNTSAPSAFSARGNHTRLVVATGRLNFVTPKPQRISTLICVFQILSLVHYNLVGGGENLSWRQFNSWRGWTKLTKLVDSPDSLFV